MPFTEALPPETKPATSGISCSLWVSSRGLRIVKLYLNAAAQERLFGRSLAKVRANVLIGRDGDEGMLKITFAEKGLFEFRATLKGSACLRIRAWDLLPQSGRNALPIEVLEHGDTGMLLKLPGWARPNGPGGKVEEASKPKPAAKTAPPVGVSGLAQKGRMKAQSAALGRAAK